MLLALQSNAAKRELLRGKNAVSVRDLLDWLYSGIIYIHNAILYSYLTKKVNYLNPVSVICLTPFQNCKYRSVGEQWPDGN